MRFLVLPLLFAQNPPPPTAAIQAQKANDPFLKGVRVIDSIVFGKNARADPLDLSGTGSTADTAPPSTPPSDINLDVTSPPPLPPKGVMPPPLGTVPSNTPATNTPATNTAGLSTGSNGKAGLKNSSISPNSIKKQSSSKSEALLSYKNSAIGILFYVLLF
eukprot:NODE_42_length_29671_cov_0.584810.p14 type:complete len:161 gc:universal NODE_42_length_29671_cov_0.584810:11976-12458(+)